jgi:predicted lipoprotein with Yx(FWY)xxD motif
MSRLAAIAIAVSGAVVAGCGDGGSTTGGQPGSGSHRDAARVESAAGKAKPAEPAASVSGLTIKTSSSRYGEVLFSKHDRAIYYFGKESTRKARCYGECAHAWPPVITSGRPQAGAGAKAALLGTTRRSDGRRQVTYDGHPLYFYVNDPPAEVGCHDVEEFGGLWLAVRRTGNPVS